MFEPKQYASIYCKISLIHVVVSQKRAGTTTIIVAVLWICKVQRSLQPKRLKSHRNYVVKNEICHKMSFSQSTVWRWCQTSSVKQPYQESKSNSLLRLGNNQIMFCFLALLSLHMWDLRAFFVFLASIQICNNTTFGRKKRKMLTLSSLI